MAKRLASACICLLIVISAVPPALAVDVPYYTYTYSNNGTALISPHAYLPGRLYDGRFDEAAGGFSKPSDIAVGPENRMYIADSGNDRVVILNEDFTFYHEIRDFYNEGAGGADAFSNPEGLFVDGEGKLYVADTDNARIVMFNADLSFRGIIRQPDAEVLPENFIYRPSALAVNRAEHIYVVSKSTIMGILELDVHSEFYGFIGAQRTRGNIWSIFWRNFMTAEQKARTFRNIPSEYNSLVIDQQGFLYATTSTIYWGNLYYAAMNKDKSSHLSPVKRFNPTGIDVMVRNGVFPTLGEIDIPLGDVRNPVYGPSVIADVALTDHGIFSLLDTRRNKIFTYTNQGELLYAFGLKSRQDGNTLAATAIVYMGHDLLVLDKDTGYIQKYDQTEYGAKLFEVIGLFENRNYERSVSLWKDILEDNGNLDIAYVGFGKSLLLDGKYAEAMDMFKSAGSVEQYSNAFKEYRKEFVEKNLGWILLAILAALAAVMLFFRFCKKVNDENKKPKARIGRLGKEMAFSMHVIFHPFDGFWDLKHEKRGSRKAATVIVLLLIANATLSSRFTGFLYKPYYDDGVTMNVVGDILTVGEKPGGKPFEIGIQRPFEDRQEIIGAVSARDSSVVTSGVYERYFIHDGKLYHHMLDAHNGYPPDNGVVSVTILSPRAVDGDGLSGAPEESTSVPHGAGVGKSFTGVPLVIVFM